MAVWGHSVSPSQGAGMRSSASDSHTSSALVPGGGSSTMVAGTPSVSRPWSNPSGGEGVVDAPDLRAAAKRVADAGRYVDVGAGWGFDLLVVVAEGENEVAFEDEEGFFFVGVGVWWGYDSGRAELVEGDRASVAAFGGGEKTPVGAHMPEGKRAVAAQRVTLRWGEHDIGIEVRGGWCGFGHRDCRPTRGGCRPR